MARAKGGPGVQERQQGFGAGLWRQADEFDVVDGDAGGVQCHAGFAQGAGVVVQGRAGRSVGDGDQAQADAVIAKGGGQMDHVWPKVSAGPRLIPPAGQKSAHDRAHMGARSIQAGDGFSIAQHAGGGIGGKARKGAKAAGCNPDRQIGRVVNRDDARVWVVAGIALQAHVGGCAPGKERVFACGGGGVPTLQGMRNPSGLMPQAVASASGVGAVVT